MRELTLNVCQGIGDIFWVYQKFAPHVDRINFNVACLPGQEKDKNRAVALRAVPWLSLLPKVGEVGHVEVPAEHYEALASGYYTMKPILDRMAEGPHDYACNRQLEDGIRLEDIDPLPIERTVPIEPEEFPMEDHVTLYVSGSTRHRHVVDTVGAWNLKDWVDFMALLYEKYKLDLPVKLIGSSFDRDVALALESALQARKFHASVAIDLTPQRVLHVIKKGLFFVGYQSGLNILADNQDCKQVMLYFKHLHRMQYAWCKRKNARAKLFNADLFSSTPKSVIDRLEMTL